MSNVEDNPSATDKNLSQNLLNKISSFAQDFRLGISIKERIDTNYMEIKQLSQAEGLEFEEMNQMIRKAILSQGIAYSTMMKYLPQELKQLQDHSQKGSTRENPDRDNASKQVAESTKSTPNEAQSKIVTKEEPAIPQLKPTIQEAEIVKAVNEIKPGRPILEPQLKGKLDILLRDFDSSYEHAKHGVSFRDFGAYVLRIHFKNEKITSMETLGAKVAGFK